MRIPLYLRIWGAVVLAVAVLTAAFAWLWQSTAYQPRPREIVIRSESGEVLGQAVARPAFVPGQGIEFGMTLNDGRQVVVQLPPRPRGPGEGPPPLRPWMRGTSGLLWMLGLVAVAVAIGTYPIVRRLTQRLESLREGVERLGGGELSARVDESGHDEVAFLARRFNQAAERIEQLVTSHKSLLANASHELRSPLARIRMGLALLEADGNAALRAEIERNVDELDQLVDEILLASRLDARSADVGTREPVDLTGLAAEECAQVGAELAASEHGAPVVVEGVSRLLRRVVRNLLENARRYSDGEVTVEVRRDGRDAVLRVCDRGPGVPPEQRERIFEPFYRLPGASERAGGVGLGLSLVKSIVQRHGGSVRCEDHAGGRGACFTVRLPAGR
ncbi:HAMP domain-containing sensor histidine kinase [Ramlibacter sp. MAHUQ-53]|uniref:HAMP domain-containing sensor histidine kinase n=1 Tax=unclassified Ramlibacter TaxID=2617605 RepID=UPI0036318F18